MYLSKSCWDVYLPLLVLASLRVCCPSPATATVVVMVFQELYLTDYLLSDMIGRVSGRKCRAVFR